MQNNKQRHLDIKILGAAFYRNQGIWKGRSPYIQVDYQGKSFKTEAAEMGGKEKKEAQWNQMFEIDPVSTDQSLRFTAYSKSILADDYLCESTVKISDLNDGQR